MPSPPRACSLALLLIGLMTAGAASGDGSPGRSVVLLLVPDGADLGAVRAARAATTPAPLLVGAGRTIALDGGLTVAADVAAAEAPEAATLVLLPGPATPALDALLRARRASAETILLIEPARPDLLTSLPGGAALVLTGRVESIRKLAGSGTLSASPAAPPPPAAAAPSIPVPVATAVPTPRATATPAPGATPVKAKTFDRYFAAATPTPAPK